MGPQSHSPNVSTSKSRVRAVPTSAPHAHLLPGLLGKAKCGGVARMGPGCSVSQTWVPRGRAGSFLGWTGTERKPGPQSWVEDPRLLGAASLSRATLFPDSESICQALATRDLLPLISGVCPWRTLGRCGPAHGGQLGPVHQQLLSIF